jgi:2-oxoglutarate ferredoxin oxidoreductase subunit alpha
MLHYRQVYPLHDRTAEYMARAERTIVVEGNATGQFAKLIELHAGVPADELLLKYNGMNFSVEEVVDGLKALIKDVA